MEERNQGALKYTARVQSAARIRVDRVHVLSFPLVISSAHTRHKTKQLGIITDNPIKNARKMLCTPEQHQKYLRDYYKSHQRSYNDLKCDEITVNSLLTTTGQLWVTGGNIIKLIWWFFFWCKKVKWSDDHVSNMADQVRSNVTLKPAGRIHVKGRRCRKIICISPTSLFIPGLRAAEEEGGGRGWGVSMRK